MVDHFVLPYSTMALFSSMWAACAVSRVQHLTRGYIWTMSDNPPLTFSKPILTLVTNSTTLRIAYRMLADKVWLRKDRWLGTTNVWSPVMWEKCLLLPLVAIWWMSRCALVQREACEMRKPSRLPVSQWVVSLGNVGNQKFGAWEINVGSGSEACLQWSLYREVWAILLKWFWLILARLL